MTGGKSPNGPGHFYPPTVLDAVPDGATMLREEIFGPVAAIQTFKSEGEVIKREVEGFHARVVQHECDHLDGVLYPQRMTDHRLLVFVEELQRNPIDLAAFLAEQRMT